MKVTWLRQVKFLLGILLVVSGGYGLTFGQDSQPLYFNAKYYMAKYDDLCKAFDANDGASFQHYQDYGKNEGRQASPVFNPKAYLNRYRDLRTAFGTNYGAALNHWLTYGIKEGRRGSKEFDAVYYLAKYPDVAKVFGAKNYDGAIRHFMEYGIREKRQGAPDFDFANSAEAGKRCFGTPFTMIIASDSQYPRVEIAPAGWPDNPNLWTEDKKKGQSVKDNRAMVTAMNGISAELNGRVKGIIINGDLTEFGHAPELEVFKLIYAPARLKAPLYLGLGNHDYANNVGQCINNQCATRMVDFMHDHITKLPVTSYDFSVKKSFNLHTSVGSMAYSWEIGNIHFIQLHNYPAYTARWAFTDIFVGSNYLITPSLNWLLKDLTSARLRNKYIIINMHDATDHFPNEHKAAYDQFVGLVKHFKVSAIFAGHFHREHGQVTTTTKIINNKVETTKIDIGAPLFLSGSANYRNFLVATFENGNLTVQKANADNYSARLKGVTVPLLE